MHEPGTGSLVTERGNEVGLPSGCRHLAECRSEGGDDRLQLMGSGIEEDHVLRIVVRPVVRFELGSSQSARHLIASPSGAVILWQPEFALPGTGKSQVVGTEEAPEPVPPSGRRPSILPVDDLLLLRQPVCDEPVMEEHLVEPLLAQVNVRSWKNDIVVRVVVGGSAVRCAAPRLDLRRELLLRHVRLVEQDVFQQVAHPSVLLRVFIHASHPNRHRQLEVLRVV